jgi:hypothetical protein
MEQIVQCPANGYAQVGMGLTTMCTMVSPTGSCASPAIDPMYQCPSGFAPQKDTCQSTSTIFPAQIFGSPTLGPFYKSDFGVCFAYAQQVPPPAPASK